MAKRKLPPMGETAALRIKALAEEIGKESGLSYGWKAEAARTLGMKEATFYNVVNGKTTSVGTKVIGQVCRKIGCNVSDLME